jgi:hypothetical protein
MGDAVRMPVKRGFKITTFGSGRISGQFAF